MTEDYRIDLIRYHDICKNHLFLVSFDESEYSSFRKYFYKLLDAFSDWKHHSGYIISSCATEVLLSMIYHNTSRACSSHVYFNEKNRAKSVGYITAFIMLVHSLILDIEQTELKLPDSIAKYRVVKDEETGKLRIVNIFKERERSKCISFLEKFIVHLERIETSEKTIQFYRDELESVKSGSSGREYIIED